MTQRLQGNSAVVTGGARGIGRATALALAQAGADVTVLDLDPIDADSVVSLRAAIAGDDRAFDYQQTDVTLSDEVDRAFAKCASQFGPVSILVNNAGKGADPVPLDGLAEKDWDAMIALNLKAAYLCSRAAVAQFKRAGRGTIVNIASTAGRGLSESSGIAYASAKAGVIGFTRQLARELGPLGIRVNAVAPGSIMTGRAAERFNAADAAARERTLAAIPLRRMGEPEDVARVVAFLASDDAGFMTGAVLDVNGGRSMV